jgi:acyl-CoA thioester hydrolase
MATGQSVTVLRVRYSETDQMGTFYNSRALEWFECGRTELLRSLGVPYAQMERRGVLLPLVEAHVKYLGRARYDDELKVTTTIRMAGRARVRFDVRIARAGGGDVAEGYTVHALTDPSGRPIRPPGWFLEALPKRRRGQPERRCSGREATPPSREP